MNRVNVRALVSMDVSVTEGFRERLRQGDEEAYFEFQEGIRNALTSEDVMLVTERSSVIVEDVRDPE